MAGRGFIEDKMGLKELPCDACGELTLLENLRFNRNDPDDSRCVCRSCTSIFHEVEIDELEADQTEEYDFQELEADQTQEYMEALQQVATTGQPIPKSVKVQTQSDIHVLYRHYDRFGDLLYVGITNNPGDRAQVHRHKSHWWRLVVDGGRTSYQRFSNREVLMEAEREAIITESPIYNVQHNQVR